MNWWVSLRTIIGIYYCTFQYILQFNCIESVLISEAYKYFHFADADYQF